MFDCMVFSKILWQFRRPGACQESCQRLIVANRRRRVLGVLQSSGRDIRLDDFAAKLLDRCRFELAGQPGLRGQELEVRAAITSDKVITT